MAFMYKQSRMLYILDLDRQDWTSAFDGATLNQVLNRGANGLALRKRLSCQTLRSNSLGL